MLALCSMLKPPKFIPIILKLCQHNWSKPTYCMTATKDLHDIVHNNIISPCYDTLVCALINTLYLWFLDCRSTAFGVHSGIGRIGAIIGNVMFGHLLDVDRAIPILIIASSLLLGGLAAVFLPPVYRPENQPPLVRLYQIIKTRVMSVFMTRTDSYGTVHVVAPDAADHKDSVAPDAADHRNSSVESTV